VISGSGGITLTNNTGLYLDNTNTYTGLTTIGATSGFYLEVAGSIAASAGVVDNGLFDIGNTTSGATIKTLSGAGLVEMGTKSLTLSAAADTFSGVISGTGALTVSGGSEVLTGTNTYSGGTTIASGATLTLGAAGTTGVIAGNVVDNGSLVINRSNDLTFAGTISGTGSLRKVGANVLTLTATNNSYSGGTTVAAGGLKGDSRALQGAIVDNGSVEFTQAVDGTYAGALTGTGTLTKSGVGALTLSGTSAITGATAVTGGKLVLQGQLGTSAATISTGATLAGTGTLVGNLVVNTGGTLAPGNSPGTLTVTGNATLNAGSSFVTEIDGRTYAAAGGSGSYDRLVVTGTTGTFNPGGTIVPVLRGISGAATNAFNPVYGDRFTVATAAIIGAGAFSAVQQPTTGLPTNSRFDVLYNTGNVQLVLTPGSYAALGQSDGWLQDGINAAGGLDAVRPAAGARNGALPSLFNGLYGMDRDHLGLAFQQVSGEIHADALQSEAGNIALLAQTVQDAGQGAFDNQANSGYAHLWGQVIGRSTTASQDKFATRYTDSSYGFLLGYAQVKDGNRFGIAAGYLQGHVNNAIGGRATSDSGTIYVYGNYELGNNLSVNGTLGYVFGRILTTRVLTLSTGTSTAASHSGYGAVNADAQLRYKTDLSDKVAAAVFAGVDFTSISAEAVNETNAADASLALSLAKKTWETARSSIGGSLSYAYDAKTQIAASASWNHTLSGLPTAQRNVTLGAANWMASSVVARRDMLGLGVNLSSQLSDKVAIKLGYTGQFDGEKYVSHSGNLVLSMKF
jgi:outer membrane autotransporter protein